MTDRGGGTAAVIPAAGRGQRLGGAVPKALHLLGGVSLLRRSVSLLADHVDVLAVAAPPDRLDEVRAELGGLACSLHVVPGGATRQASVAVALAALPADVSVVLVHDAARPLMPVEVVVAVLDAVRAGAAAVVPVLPIADTVKQTLDGRVTATVDRSRLVAVQTPQGFRRDVLEQAHRAGEDPLTDDAGLVEAIGVPVDTVPGSPLGFKITTPYDVVLAEALLAATA